jgi:putative transposase
MDEPTIVARTVKPTDNAFVESFNGTFWDECLNVHWFETLAEAKQLIEAWRQEYNGSRPHRALDDLTPSEFAGQFAASRALTAA